MNVDMLAPEVMVMSTFSTSFALNTLSIMKHPNSLDSRIPLSMKHLSLERYCSKVNRAVPTTE